MDRDQLRLKKQRECDIKIQGIYDRLPRLGELDREIGALNIAMIRQGIMAKNEEAQKALQREIEARMAERHDLLEANGMDETVYEPDWDCPICKDRGYVEPGVPCSCFRQEQLETLFRNSGMSEAMARRTFANFDCSLYEDVAAMEEKVAWCRAFAEDIQKGYSTRSLFLTGDVGRGKTHLSAAIANEVLAGGNTVIYRRATDLFQFIRQSMFEENGPKYRAIMDQLRNCDLLVIDDLGAEKTSEFNIEQLVILLEERNDRDKPWIINSNLSLTEISDVYGNRVSDRILERAVAFRMDRASSVRLDKAMERMAQF